MLNRPQLVPVPCRYKSAFFFLALCHFGVKRNTFNRQINLPVRLSFREFAYIEYQFGLQSKMQREVHTVSILYTFIFASCHEGAVAQVVERSLSM